MKMLIVFLIGSIVLLASVPVVAQHGGKVISSVFIMDADGTNQRPLFPYPVSASALDVSPDGTRIAYSRSGRLGLDVWVSDFGGGNAVNLTDSSGISEFGPSWSPDGSRIAFMANPSGNGDVFIMDADGQNIVNLTNHPASDGGPAWSPDGNRIAFHSNRDGPTQIYLMNADGSGIRNVTNNTSENTFHIEAAWSPDGNRIAFVEVVGLERHIYLINITGEPPQALFTEPSEARHPSWSPDASRIAFSLYREGITDIFLMNPGGEDLLNLTHGVGTNGQPTWTPDGRIVFATTRSPEELEEIDRQFLGPDRVLIILEEGGLSFELRRGNMPPVRLRRTNAAGETEDIPLDRGEAERILRRRGESYVKLDSLFSP